MPLLFSSNKTNSACHDCTHEKLKYVKLFCEYQSLKLLIDLAVLRWRKSCTKYENQNSKSGFAEWKEKCDDKFYELFQLLGYGWLEKKSSF